jgi:predicted RNase H-like HicB family nuclease
MKRRRYSIVLEPEEGGGYAVTVPALPGVFTQGRTVEEAKERAAEAISTHIAGLQADGEPIPEELEPPRLVSITVAA